MPEKVLLVDADSKIPNIALMKLKRRYPYADFIKLNLSAYPHKHYAKVQTLLYDRIFCSIVFQQNKDRVIFEEPWKVEFGGSGYDLSKKLPDEIDSLIEDYSIYPDTKGSYIFMTRGCPNKCWFCFVPQKEGKLHEYHQWNNRIQHKSVYFLDNNFLAWDKHEDVLEQLIKMNLKCQFNQGLDIRKLNHINASMLSKLNYINEYIFAYDDVNYYNIIDDGITLFNQYIKRTDWRTKFFVYCNPSMSLAEINTRIKHLRQRKSLPYIMRDFTCYDKLAEHYDYYIDIATWCNQPALFKNMDFWTFLTKRHPKNKSRQISSFEKWDY